MMTMEEIRALIKLWKKGNGLDDEEVNEVLDSLLVIRDNAYEQGREDEQRGAAADSDVLFET